MRLDLAPPLRRIGDLHAAVDGAEKLAKVQALALFGGIRRVKEIGEEVRAWYEARAAHLIRQCRSGAHSTGARIADALAFMDEVGTLAQRVRKPQEAGR
ncbi:hypothetical protein [Streptomyces sp. 8L]|uniref:hypothetical protein n=1 Tax=Streptomyces sp. 8L TaxID=2877242 RepID=UPI001CD38D49|nr:hypothetical protein [Streptomyces sp. 8L]MCA1223641.1 hypothetical protein [Streptomyces sp. 8L]